jgi:hypothetical protein
VSDPDSALPALERLRERQLAREAAAPTCANCRFWRMAHGELRESGDDFVLDEREGSCGHNAPPWPTTAADDWCGEHSAGRGRS